MLRIMNRLDSQIVSLRNKETTELDYVTRTNIERDLFLLTTAYAEQICGVKVDGIIYAHWSELIEAYSYRIDPHDLSIIELGKNTYILLRRLSSANPYEVADTVYQHGGRARAAETLANSIDNFISSIKHRVCSSKQ